MKKGLSIFFLFIFFVFQYGKMLDYVECRIAAVLQSTKDCGCDTKLTASANEQAPQPLHQHQLKNYTEEFYQHPIKNFPNVLIKKSLSYKIQPPTQLAVGFCKNIFHPPRV